MRSLLMALTVFFSSNCVPAKTETPDPEIGQKQWVETCTKWDDWDKPGPPFQISANTYYVGTCGISSILITGADGHILIDSGTEAGAGIIAENIGSLGFEISDVQILLHSHEHFDHVAGLAELQRLSGAMLYASTAAKPVIETGQTGAGDPQHGMHDPFPPARVDKTVGDGEIIGLGSLSLKAIATPGHTEGALSWQWRSCADGACEWIVYADSLSPISHDEYRFSDHGAYVANYRKGLDHLRQLDCTLLMTPHPSASQMHRRLLEGQLSKPKACAIYADAISVRLEKRLEKETSE